MTVPQGIVLGNYRNVHTNLEGVATAKHIYTAACASVSNSCRTGRWKRRRSTSSAQFPWMRKESCSRKRQAAGPGMIQPALPFLAGDSPNWGWPQCRTRGRCWHL
ncbi:hypothetical protein SAMN00790413_03421 [Deinococcus hopiensis KR-140]|uniref:Uncharacterized protein n=1 Tax=Deinococcus hopiensis KR-140 TaxID=695939 RepID=A0A1W1UWN0_9DEIO|nr:hypothetical protein SAMN00790413_03421 [Deinococcus hopiensis KR-140]